jgi:opacity protein-like surface antigen
MIIFIIVLALPFLIPINVSAQSPFYIAFKPGIYSPQSSDLDGFDTGFNGEIALGYRFHRNIAAEFGLGYFNTQEERTFVGSTYVGKELDIYVYPVTFTLKAILPYKKWEFFGLAGAGVYIVSGAYDADDWDYDDDDDYDYDAVFGGYLGGGIHYNITPKIFVGVEGKYLWTDKAKLEFEEFGAPPRVKFKMEGILATAVIGIRF